jgi:RES domain-containing protein
MYLSCTRDGALAEADYHLSLQVPRPTVKRTIYDIDVSLDNTLDLTDGSLLADLGLSAAELNDPAMVACQAVGGAAAWLGHDGIHVPSVRSAATHLVIFPANRAGDARFEILAEEDIPS